MSSGQRKHRNCCLLIIFVAMLFSLLTLRPYFLESQSDMEWLSSFSNEKCWSTGHSGNWVLRLYIAFLLLIRRKVSDSPLWGAIRGTQRGFTGWQEQPWPLLPNSQLRSCFPRWQSLSPWSGKGRQTLESHKIRNSTEQGHQSAKLFFHPIALFVLQDLRSKGFQQWFGEAWGLRGS